MSVQPKFKIKRPHSPDHIGICNYKKQRLLYDLENLSICDDENVRKGSMYSRHRHPASTKDTVPNSIEGIYLPYTTENHALKLIQSESSVLGDTGLLYAKLKTLAHTQALQLVKWIDVKGIAYAQWLKWFQKHFSYQDIDYDMDERRSVHYFRPSYLKDNHVCDRDEDIDMDDA